MTTQRAVTVLASLTPGTEGALDAALARLGCDPGIGALAFGRLTGVHFARLLVVPGAEHSGRALPPALLYASSIDVSVDEHLVELARIGAEGVDCAFAHCSGYPEESQRDERTRLAFLRQHLIPTQAFYVNTVGRTVRQVYDESRLRDRIQQYLDEQERTAGWASRTGDEVYVAIREFVAQNPDLRWALRPAEGRSRLHRLRESVRFTTLIVAGLIVLPVLAPLTLLALLRLRFEEWRDARAGDVPHHLVPRSDLASAEDLAAHNQFSAAGFIRLGRFRSAIATVTLWVANVGARHLYADGDLGTVRPLGLHGVDTIHFARWIRIDEGQRVVFLSNYDGSFERYMDDFINKVAWGLNAVFTHGVGYPPTRWVFFEGARNEQAFKAFLRERQLPTAVWYSAYPWLTNANIRNNAEIRAGLTRRLDAEGVARWLQRL